MIFFPFFLLFDFFFLGFFEKEKSKNQNVSLFHLFDVRDQIKSRHRFIILARDSGLERLLSLDYLHAQ